MPRRGRRNITVTLPPTGFAASLPSDTDKGDIIDGLGTLSLDDSSSSSASIAGDKSSMMGDAETSSVNSTTGGAARRRRRRNNNKKSRMALSGNMPPPPPMPKICEKTTSETKPVRLLLGLNLDVDLQLKAKIQGDVSLTLLVEEKPSKRPETSKELKPSWIDGTARGGELFFMRITRLRFRQRWIDREVSPSLTWFVALGIALGGFALGFLASRFLAVQQLRQQQQQQQPTQQSTWLDEPLLPFYGLDMLLPPIQSRMVY